MNKSINEIAKDVHANAVAHGWWEDGERNFGELLQLCGCELAEAMEEYRNGHGFTETYYSCCAPKGEADKMLDGKESGIEGCGNYGTGCKNQCIGHYGKPEGIPIELADVVIRVMDICGYYGIDLEAAILKKHEFNKTRPYRHGGKKA